jgi:RNA polymerase sigma-70 factor, ECF subfamily
MNRTRALQPSFLVWPTRQSSADELVTDCYRREAVSVTRVVAGHFRRRTWDVEEVVDEAFMRLREVFAAGVFVENPAGWVVTVAHRLMLDRIRKDKAYAELLTKYSMRPPSDHIATIEEILFDRERTMRLRHAIAGLPELERTCLLSRAKGLKLREIGPLVGLDPRRVAETIERIVMTLQEQVRV